MPDPSATMPNAATIDRLVLDIPGLDARQARTIAEDLAVLLGRANVAGMLDRITIELEDDQDLAMRIAAALRERLL